MRYVDCCPPPCSFNIAESGCAAAAAGAGAAGLLLLLLLMLLCVRVADGAGAWPCRCLRILVRPPFPHHVCSPSVPLSLSLSLSTRLLALRPARRCSLSAIWTSVCLSVRPSVCLRAACRRRRLELQRRHSAATTLKLCCDIAVIRDCHCRWPLSRPSPTANQLPEVVFKLVLVAARHVTVE